MSGNPTDALGDDATSSVVPPWGLGVLLAPIMVAIGAGTAAGLDFVPLLALGAITGVVWGGVVAGVLRRGRRRLRATAPGSEQLKVLLWTVLLGTAASVLGIVSARLVLG